MTTVASSYPLPPAGKAAPVYYPPQVPVAHPTPYDPVPAYVPQHIPQPDPRFVSAHPQYAPRGGTIPDNVRVKLQLVPKRGTASFVAGILSKTKLMLTVNPMGSGGTWEAERGGRAHEGVLLRRKRAHKTKSTLRRTAGSPSIAPPPSRPPPPPLHPQLTLSSLSQSTS
jgi:hypothetical protein